jgi:solute carrier family 25 carnitine/acylcarnitine transporter 20/29
MDPVGDFACGTAGGIVSKFVDYPFDTVKVRMQAQGHLYKSTWDCVKTIATKEGLNGFYAGVAAPIGGAAFENAFVFLSYGRGKALYRYLMGVADDAPDPTACIWFAGAIGGFSTSMVLTPVELLKCRVQNQPDGTERKYKGVLDCGLKTVRAEGVGALFNGVNATLMREVPGNACWFGMYEASKTLFVPKGGTKADVPWYAAPICGGIGGFFYWSACFPADVVKTRMQTDAEWLKLGVFKGLKRIYKEGGIAALYSGYGITCCRAFPANATVFSVYEATSSMWMKKFHPEAAAADSKASA